MSNLAAKAMNRFRRMTSQRDTGSVGENAFFSLPPMLDAFRTWTQRQAERGVSHLANARIGNELEDHFQQLRTYGFTGFAQQEGKETKAAEALLQSHDIGMQYMRLLDHTAQESDLLNA